MQEFEVAHIEERSLIADPFSGGHGADQTDKFPHSSKRFFELYSVPIGDYRLGARPKANDGSARGEHVKRGSTHCYGRRRTRINADYRGP